MRSRTLSMFTGKVLVTGPQYGAYLQDFVDRLWTFETKVLLWHVMVRVEVQKFLIRWILSLRRLLVIGEFECKIHNSIFAFFQNFKNKVFFKTLYKKY